MTDPTRVRDQPALTQSSGLIWLVVGSIFTAIALGVLIALVQLPPPGVASRIDARLFGEYRFSDIVGLNTTLMYDQAMGPDTPIPVAPANDLNGDGDTTDAGEAAINDDLEYKRFQAYIGMRVFW
jgi:hypothetical protein